MPSADIQKEDRSHCLLSNLLKHKGQLTYANNKGPFVVIHLYTTYETFKKLHHAFNKYIISHKHIFEAQIDVKTRKV